MTIRQVWSTSIFPCSCVEPKESFGLLACGEIECQDARLLERARKRSELQIRREQVLTADPHPIRLDDLMGGYVTRQALIVLRLSRERMAEVRVSGR